MISWTNFLFKNPPPAENHSSASHDTKGQSVNRDFDHAGGTHTVTVTYIPIDPALRCPVTKNL